MAERPVKAPTAEHPITIAPTAGRVVVRVNGDIIADSRAALTLQESSYPAVQYIPLADVNQQLLRRTQTVTYCPYKGEAGYFSVAGEHVVVDDAVWFYEQPYPAVAAIAEHVAFYPDKAEITISPG